MDCIKRRAAARRASVPGEGSRRCVRCESDKPYDAFSFSRNRWGNICRDCANGRRRVQRAAVVEGKPLVRDHHKKLPPYEVLKAYVVNDGLTYKEIAEKYGTWTASVYRNLRARATRRGEWPLLTPAQRTQRAARGMSRAGYSVNGRVIREMVREYLDEQGLTRKKFADDNGFQDVYIRDLVSRRNAQKNILIPHAVRLLRAMGEPVPDWLLTRAREFKTFEDPLAA